MSNARRKKLEDLRQKALGPRGSKREKLKAVLKKKLTDKYGNKWESMEGHEIYGKPWNPWNAMNGNGINGNA